MTVHTDSLLDISYSESETYLFRINRYDLREKKPNMIKGISLASMWIAFQYIYKCWANEGNYYSIKQILS